MEEEKADLVPTRAWMRSLIASFSENATRDDNTAYPAELLPQGWAIITTMLSRAKYSDLSLSDPMTHALNTEKGHAVGAMYNHALRACRVARPDNTIAQCGIGRVLEGVFNTETRQSAVTEISSFRRYRHPTSVTFTI